MPEIGMALDIFNLRRQLCAAPNMREAFGVTLRALTDLGASEFSYGALTKTGLAARPIAIDLFHASLDAPLLAKLGGKGRYENDLTGARAVAGLDTDWSEDRHWDHATPAQLAQSAREMDMGFSQGYTFVLGQSGGTTFAAGVGMGGLTAPEFARHWPQLSAQVQAILQVLDGYFQNDKTLQRASGRTGICAHYALSPREKDVLCWLARGLRPDEIAQVLGVGYRTVDKYIVAARAKLGARTRDHAVAKAMVLRLISP